MGSKTGMWARTSNAIDVMKLARSWYVHDVRRIIKKLALDISHEITHISLLKDHSLRPLCDAIHRQGRRERCRAVMRLSVLNTARNACQVCDLQDQSREPEQMSRKRYYVLTASLLISATSNWRLPSTRSTYLARTPSIDQTSLQWLYK